MCLRNVIIDTLKNEVTPAMGCTEPVAVALACAKAREILDCDSIEMVEVWVSSNIYKNGLGVGVPNTSEVGLHIAAALGVSGCNSLKGLNLLEDINEYQLSKANKLIKQGKLAVLIKDTHEKVYVEARIHTNEHSASATIMYKHNCFVRGEKDGTIIFNRSIENKSSEQEIDIIFGQKIEDLIREIEEIEFESIDFLLDGITMNEKIALKALDMKLGIGVGYGMKESIRKGLLSNDFINNAMMMTAAAADARMSGISLPVMSSNGSGNNGLTAILPLAVYRKMYNVGDDKIVKALAISHIVNCYIKNHIGRLSALCGCAVSAATGASVAIAWLMGANYEEINGTIKNMIANISGMICDGAKGSCALKVSTATSVAVQSAILAINGSITPSKNGIIGESAEECIINLGVLSLSGMNDTDRVILDIMKKMA